MGGGFGFGRLPARLSGSALGSCAAPQNPIEAENCNPGSPSSQWDIIGAGDSSIQGFVNQGQTVYFKINTNASSYHQEIYRMWY